MYCICCKKNKVSPYDVAYQLSRKVDGKISTEEDLLWMKKTRFDEKGNTIGFITIDNEMVSDGIIQIVNAGYGSKHDTNRFIIAICDDCINENLEDGTLLYYGNYMYGSGVEVDKRVEKSKKIYRRRKNLDNISNVEDV
jgi:hypothetical protein